MDIKWIGFLRIVVGVFLLVHGINNFGWFSSSEALRTELQASSTQTHPATQWVQKHIVRPYIEIWARVIPAGELLFGAALIAGFLARTVLVLSILMTLLYHIADGRLFSPQIITDANGMLFLACLVTLAFLRSGSVFSVK